MKVKRNRYESIIITRRWAPWQAKITREHYEKANSADAEELARQGEEELGAIGMVLGVIVSLIPVVLIFVCTMLEWALMLITLPFLLIWRETRGHWTVEVIDRKARRRYFWEEKGFFASRRLMKKLATTYKKSSGDIFSQ